MKQNIFQNYSWRFLRYKNNCNSKIPKKKLDFRNLQEKLEKTVLLWNLHFKHRWSSDFPFPDNWFWCLQKKNAARYCWYAFTSVRWVMDFPTSICKIWYFVSKLVLTFCEGKIVLVIEKNFEIIRTIFFISERSQQLLKTECFFNLFLEVSQI